MLPQKFKLTWYRWLLNFWPCIRGTGARITYISPDYHQLKVELPLNWRTRNLVRTIFGGSIYASTDPFYMIMLMRILGKNYIVWDKGAKVEFLRPGTSTLYIDFTLSPADITRWKEEVHQKGEIVFDLPVSLNNAEGKTCARVTKVMYIATKEAYLAKQERRRQKESEKSA